jgi:hypothetical protein
MTISPTTTLPANPFYAARLNRTARPRPPTSEIRNPRYALLPTAPRNASPVPELTSLYHNPDPGPWGDRRYPGNCSGTIIRDLLRYFQPATVFDSMSGSGTCREVCEHLGIPVQAGDLRYGQDATNPAAFPRNTTFPFVWIHPPYWRQKLYTNDPRDLSQKPTLETFLDSYARLIANCASVLEPGGKLAVLMGDYSDRDAGYVPLVYWTKHFAFAAGLQQHCTDIIRFSHGATSSRKVYRSSFIPGLHDVCMVFERPQAILDKTHSPALMSATTKQRAKV